jgi:hypothetical protein
MGVLSSVYDGLLKTNSDKQPEAAEHAYSLLEQLLKLEGYEQMECILADRTVPPGNSKLMVTASVVWTRGKFKIFIESRSPAMVPVASPEKMVKEEMVGTAKLVTVSCRGKVLATSPDMASCPLIGAVADAACGDVKEKKISVEV